MRSLLKILGLLTAILSFAQSAEQTKYFSPRLPASVYGIISSHERLWAFGGNELVAVSDDLGKRWKILHNVSGGRVLLNGSVLSDNVVYLTGTGGTIETTRDAGQSWHSISIGPKAILLSAFADESNAIAVTTDGAFITADGWKTWSPVKELFEDEAGELKYVLTVAALPPNRFVLMLKEGAAAYYGRTGFLVTNDGGKRWDFVEVPHTTIHSLSAVNGRFWITGTEVIDRDKIDAQGHKGGHAVPMVMDSSDGKTWTSEPRPLTMLSSCNSSGCLGDEGVWIDPFNGYRLRLYSPVPVTTLKWASAGRTICLVSGNVFCGEAQDAKELPATHKYLPVAVSPVSFNRHQEKPPICISCPIETIFVDPHYGGGAMVTIRFEVKPDGTTDDISVLNSPSEKIKKSIEDSVKTWILDPAIENGQPVAARKQVEHRIAVIKND